MQKIIPVFLVVLMFSSLTFARPAKRITFAIGATKTTASGKLKGFKDSQVFLLKLRANQKLTVLSNDSVTITITDPFGNDVSDMDLSCNRNKVVKPTVAGTYRITVTECKKADPWIGTFRLKVSVR